MSELMKGKLIPAAVIKLLWEKFTMKVKIQICGTITGPSHCVVFLCSYIVVCSLAPREEGYRRMSWNSYVLHMIITVVIEKGLKLFRLHCNLFEDHWKIYCSRSYKNVNCSFQIFPRSWLVKTTRIIHHNKLLLTKFGKNFVILKQRLS